MFVIPVFRNHGLIIAIFVFQCFLFLFVFQRFAFA